MADLLLTHSYFLNFDPKQLRAGTPYAPLATLFAAAVLQKNHYNVAFFDTMFCHNANEIAPAILEHKPKLFVIYDDGFNYLTKMCLTNMREAAFEMIKAAKEQGCKVAISSSDSTDHAEQYLQKGADFVIAGEGEQTLLELSNFLLRNEGTIETIDGLIWLKEGELQRNTKRNNLRNLDELPLPAWDLVDMKPYQQMWLNHKGYFSINMVTTRGCPFKCNWCAKPIYGNRYNSRSPENVIAEIKLLKQKLNINHIWFADDIFGLKPGWVSQFATLAKQENLQFKFKIQSRVDLLLEEDNIKHLADAGCDEVWVGAESGSQKILDAMDKGTKVEQIETATLLMKQQGIKPCFFLQFGYPSEEAVDIKSTISMLKRLMPHDIGISVSYPLPGTKFYDNVKSQLKQKQNWTDSDELLVMFNSTYPADFYKQLQRLVHYQFRKWKALEAWKTKNNVKQGAVALMRVPQVMWAKQQMKKYAAGAF
ncbi:MAG: radical SAM protein [Bacteroidetes bacterium]|nr:MAG: radical SAM protein [Bacteroidota bacterium]